VTGGIGLAAAGFMLDENVDSNKDSADQIQDFAEQRRTWLQGLYAAQECEGPFDPDAVQNAAAPDAPSEQVQNIEPAAGETTPSKPQTNKQTEQTKLNTPYND
jgi:hypothetical protein